MQINGQFWVGSGGQGGGVGVWGGMGGMGGGGGGWRGMAGMDGNRGGWGWGGGYDANVAPYITPPNSYGKNYYKIDLYIL